MKNTTMKMVSAVFAGCLLTTVGYAAPVLLSPAQMDSVAAGGVQKVDGFVCPSIPTDAVTANGKDKFFAIGDGYYSFHGPDVSVPMLATNADGAGRPGGEFAKPGDSNYSAIWGFRP